MDYEKIAKTILEELDQKAPATINHNFEKIWVNAIVSGLKKAVDKGELDANVSNL